MGTIITFPNAALRIKTEEIKEINGKVKKNMEKLRDVLGKCANGVGLAATQLGWSERMFAMKDLKTGQVKVLINPSIVEVWGDKCFPRIINAKGQLEEEPFLEGCLSFPNIFGTVKRYLKIKGKWDGTEKILEGFEAVVFQHELDHLNGILFTDRVRENKGKLYRLEGENREELSLQNYLEQF